MNDIANTCRHKYRHIDNRQYSQNVGGQQNQYVLIDRFFCIYCLAIREVKRTEWSVKTPDWYTGKQASQEEKR